MVGELSRSRYTSDSGSISAACAEPSFGELLFTRTEELGGGSDRTVRDAPAVLQVAAGWILTPTAIGGTLRRPPLVSA